MLFFACPCPNEGGMMVNGKEYIWQGDMESNEFTNDDKIGEVKEKVMLR